ncbi:LADA_0F01882g1_1 [Lachancea dasiensis]|uniref:Protein SQS1 n=1 Tax=Lachancea dasiensis TaxID=1072105 RepID=A0A1G4JI52_9SACH|nr:LADA_0F01882g1_1 [Lachancea dasiensis]
MAKRHGHYRARGTGRRQGGRGNFKKAKNIRKQVSSRSKNGGYNGGVVPVGGGDLGNADMIDDYYFGHNYGQNSMHMGGFRPGKHKQAQENEYESDLPRRKRPVEFVKAKDTYDPSRELIDKLNNARNELKAVIPPERSSDDGKTLEVETEKVAQSEEETEADSTQFAAIHGSTAEGDFEGNSEEDLEKGYEVPVNIQHENGGERTFAADIPNEELFFVDEAPELPAKLKTVAVDVADDKANKAINTDFEPTLVIGKTQLELVQDQDGSTSVVVAGQKSHPFKGRLEEEEESLHDATTQGFYDSCDPESDDFDDFSDNDGHLIEIDQESKDGYQYTVPSTRRESPMLSSTIQSLTLNDEGSNSETKNDIDDRTPAFGFLDEDFILNVSDLSITNIRLGAQQNSYYLSNYQYFGDFEPRWVDQDDLTDFVLELGLPHHRVGPYLEYVMDSIIPKETKGDQLEAKIAKEATMLASETESAEDDVSEKAFCISDNDDDELGDDLEDLVAYSMKYEAVRNQTYETKSIPTSGRGGKKKLLFDDQLDLDQGIKDELQDKLSTRSKKKASKRNSKEDYVSEQNGNSEDLFLKYPYGFHVENIKDEFEFFLAGNRVSMSFPPLDPHGNKTVASFAEAYNMKGRKVGKSGKTHVMVEKVKKTKWALPNYNYISQLLRRRPIFMRIDVRKPREDRFPSEKSSEKAKFHVKEGEIVGEDAPEIGTDNIGRRMLEKLGWSSGQGLGAQGNQGISEPIFAKVKNTKSGLRQSG